MKSSVIGSNPRIVSFYSSYMDMLGVVNEAYNSINVGLKRAILDKKITSLIVIIENRDDLVTYNRLKDLLDERRMNTFVVCVDESLMQQVSNSRVISISHKSVTLDFSEMLAKSNVCKPYLKETGNTRSPEKIFEHIKFMLARGNITLPVEGECAVRILSVLDHDNITFKAIDGMTKLDPALHSGIIRMANSAYFSGSYGNIADVQKALVRLGINNIKAYLVNFINKSLAANKNLLYADEIGEAIKDSQIIGALCYVMSDFFKVCAKGQMYSVGLLSKIGEIFILAIISDYLSGERPEDVKDGSYRKMATQNNILVGGTLMKKWKFSEEFYIPLLFSGTLKENQFMNETKILHLACNMLVFFRTEQIDDGLKAALNKTGIQLSEKQLQRIKTETEIKIKDFAAVY
ncbi:HDOD domain-containing protein [Seleniivibrio sp.]|uniref:HDOD domain-containing protein n=1 Tax=Seleniivibrio sp. TaxID=2898801 RepID=UPI0025CDD5B2|nr:HDOD domain-containing protein [Seleniivibrio sp.]MCD8553581.1 HDOD domain-containing protein [Seleniivibrio sp.]